MISKTEGKTAGKKRIAKSGAMHKPAPRPAPKNVKSLSAKVESLLPAGSPQRAAADVAVAAGGALLVAAAVGVGPAALAGAAGYVAYRETQRKKLPKVPGIKHARKFLPWAPYLH